VIGPIAKLNKGKSQPTLMKTKRPPGNVQRGGTTHLPMRKKKKEKKKYATDKEGRPAAWGEPKQKKGVNRKRV